MKVAIILSAVLGLCSFGFGQTAPPAAVPASTSATAQIQSRRDAPPLTNDEIAAVARFQSNTVTRVLGVSVRVDGVIPQAVRTGHPLQLINPFAPPEYGNGFQNVTVDPESGRANGIRFLGIKF